MHHPDTGVANLGPLFHVPFDSLQSYRHTIIGCVHWQCNKLWHFWFGLPILSYEVKALLEQLKCLRSENSPCHPTITRTIDLYRIPFIPNRKHIVQHYYYKSMNLTNSGTYVKGYTNYLYYICIKFESSSVKSGLKWNAKKCQITH